MFNKGDKVKDKYTGEIFVVKTAYWQDYAGTRDLTVVFEPAFHLGQWQETPWNKGSNLIRVS